MSNKNKMVAYKAMNNDMTCRGFQYEIGKEYHIDGEIQICRNGFHSCLNPFDVLNFYPRNSRFFKVLVGGDIEEQDGKTIKVGYWYWFEDGKLMEMKG